MGGMVAVANAGNGGGQKKEILPSHGWSNLTGKNGGSGKVIKLSDANLPLWQRQEIIAKAVLSKVGNMELQPLTREEKDAWLARLLGQLPKNSHSC